MEKNGIMHIIIGKVRERTIKFWEEFTAFCVCGVFGGIVVEWNEQKI